MKKLTLIAIYLIPGLFFLFCNKQVKEEKLIVDRIIFFSHGSVTSNDWKGVELPMFDTQEVSQAHVAQHFIRTIITLACC